MIGEVMECQNLGCEVMFVKKTHNQRYHDDECCRLATNRKIMEKYYARRAQRLGITRLCDKCETKLSRYNNNTTCNSCLLKSEVARTNSVAAMLSTVTL